MKGENNSKRNIIQWIAFGIVMLTLVLKLVLFVTGIAQNLAYSSIDTMTWCGLTIGIILLLISYLFPKNTRKNTAHSN